MPADRGTELEVPIEGLGLIALRGKVVTGDALHCNRRTVEAINARGGDWCLALKGIQESLLFDARGYFSGAIDPRQQAMTEEKNHGRKEVRKATIVSAKSLGAYHAFQGLKAFGRIDASRELDGKVTSETRYFALSWMPTPDIFLATVRDRWLIENALHWQLDVSFREDAARNRKDNATGKIAVLRRHSLDVVRQDKSKSSLSIKLKRAGWDDAFLRSIFSNIAKAWRQKRLLCLEPQATSGRAPAVTRFISIACMCLPGQFRFIAFQHLAECGNPGQQAELVEALSDCLPSTGNGAAQIILAGQRRLRCRSVLHGVTFLCVTLRFDHPEPKAPGKQRPPSVKVQNQLGHPLRRGAGFQSNNASRVLGEEREQLSLRNFFTEYDGSIDARAVQMKNALCKIDPDDGNFGHGCILLL